jgi:hypothetical protein
LLVAGGGAAVLAPVAGASSLALPSLDLAYARLLVAGELLAANFYTQALAAATTGRSVTA